MNEIVDAKKQRMISRTLIQILMEQRLTVEEFQGLLDVQTRILERLLKTERVKY